MTLNLLLKDQWNPTSRTSTSATWSRPNPTTETDMRLRGRDTVRSSAPEATNASNGMCTSVEDRVTSIPAW